MKSTRVLSILGLGGLVAVATSMHLGCGSDSNNGSGGAGASTSSSSSAGGSANNGGSSNGGSSNGGSSAGGGGAGGGTGGAGVGGFSAPNETWTYIPVDGAKCINDTATGIGVNLESGSDDVIIYMEGGNACFNAASCDVTFNTSGYGPTQFNSDVTQYLGAPLFDRTVSLFKSYNFVYIPYCTGDVHAGDNDTTVAGTMRHFHGAHNMDLYLARMKAAFPHAKNIVISGSSAGGFGAAFNYDRTAKVFPNVKVALIDDSGPPMAEAFVPACLQKYFMQTWGLAKTLPADCADCTPSDGGFMEPLVKYISTTYADRRLSLISSSQDGTISQFWGYGDGDCMNPGLSGLPGAYPGTEYAMGLQDLRDRIIGDSQPNFKAFIIDTTQADGNDDTHHVWLDQDPTMLVENGVTYETFLQQQLSGDANWANEGLP